MITQTIAKLVAIVFVLALVGCAAARPPAGGVAPGPTEDEQRIATGAEMEISHREAALSTLSGEANPDCARICELVANICDLAGRICKLARQDPAANLEPRCQDAELRCDRAPELAAGRCDCQTAGK